MMWVKAADDMLQKLWRKGDSAAIIADKMREAGYNVSRNACIGRRFRLKKLPGANMARNSLIPINGKRRRKVEKTRAENTTTVAASREPVTSAQIEALLDNPGVEYLQNGSKQCKALINKYGADGLPMCCGRPCGPDYMGRTSVYCPTHFRMFHNPPAQRMAHG